MAENNQGRDLWYPLTPNSPYCDHEWRVERYARDAEHTQIIINFFRRLVRLPIRRDPGTEADKVRQSYRTQQTAERKRDCPRGKHPRRVDILCPTMPSWSQGPAGPSKTHQ
jgi:hypothetical protein